MHATPERSLPGFLDQCLVEGDAAALARAKRLRRRSLLLSLAVQVGLLAALVLLPLFASSGLPLVTHVVTPIPPYGKAGKTREARAEGGQLRPPNVQKPHGPLYQPLRVPPQISTQNSSHAAAEVPEVGASGPPGGQTAISGLVPGADRRVAPPPTSYPAGHKGRVAHSSDVQSALLVRRVEPVYPLLAIQAHREGTVRLRAMIATNGLVSSLEVLSGDPILAQAARDAVQQWRYRPTLLNGEPVEVETYITVIFQLQR